MTPIILENRIPSNPEEGRRQGEQTVALCDIVEKNREILGSIFPDFYNPITNKISQLKLVYDNPLGLEYGEQIYRTPPEEGLHFGIARFNYENFYRPYIGSGWDFDKKRNRKADEETKFFVSRKYPELNMSFRCRVNSVPSEGYDLLDYAFSNDTHSFDVEALRFVSNWGRRLADADRLRSQFHENRFITKEDVCSIQYNPKYFLDYEEILRGQQIINERLKLFLSPEKCTEVLEKLELITGLKPKFLSLEGSVFKIGI